MEDMLQYADMNPDSRIARSMKADVTQNEAVLNAWVDAVSEGVENFRMQDGQKKNAQGSVKFSIRRTKNMSWTDQIRGALYGENTIARNDTLVVGSISEFLVQDGVEQKPPAISLSVLKKSSSGKDVSHSIKKGKIAKLDNGIKNAPIIIINPSRNAIVYVTNIKQGGAPILAAFNRNTIFDGDDVHKATSIHLQIDVQSMLDNLPGDATVYVQNENELAAVGATNNLRGLAANVKFISNDIVNGENKNVNGNILKSSRNQTKTDSFKRWFGDWQNDPQKASKVVNADGTPKRLYRYTNLEDTVINPDYRGAIWMADNDWVTSQYGSRYDVLYANMRNPYVFNVDGLDFSKETALVNARKGGHDGLIIHFKFTGENNDYYQFIVENAPNTDARQEKS